MFNIYMLWTVNPAFFSLTYFWYKLHYFLENWKLICPCLIKDKGSPRPARNIRSGGDGDNFAQVSRGLWQRDSRGYPHQCDSFVVAFATMYSSDEEEALLLLALEDEISRFVFLSDRCRSYIIFFPPWYAKPFFFSGERKGSGSTKSI